MWRVEFSDGRYNGGFSECKTKSAALSVARRYVENNTTSRFSCHVVAEVFSPDGKFYDAVY